MPNGITLDDVVQRYPCIVTCVVTATAGETLDSNAPLVILFHGRGSNEQEIIGLSGELPNGNSYVALRGPIELAPGNYAWFQNRGIGRPIAESLRETLDWFYSWLEPYANSNRKIILIGFSGGAAFVGGLTLDRSELFAGSAVLYGTFPFEAGLEVSMGGLNGYGLFHAQGDNDDVMPRDLMDRTWRYVTQESGATVTALRSQGGHSITSEVVAALVSWIMNLTKNQ